MASKRAASSTPTLTHATPRAIPGSASSETHLFPASIRDRQRRASGTPTSLPRRDSESTSVRPTRARVGPLPKNGPGNPLFPPLPPKFVKPRRDSQMSLMERMEERDGEMGDESAIRDEEDKEPEEWDEYSAKQRRQRGFHAGDAEKPDVKPDAEEADMQKDETKEEDHETMTSGLSENEAGNESAEEGQIEDTADAESAKTVKAEPEPSPKESKPQAEDAESHTSSEKRSLRNRTTAAESANDSTKADVKQRAETVDVDMDVTITEDVVEVDLEEEIAAGDRPEGQVDANGDVTRCVCGREADIDAMMIQCDHCNVWQHGACVGIWGDEEAPDEYFCELCKPNLHAPLRRFLRQRTKQGLGFSVPTPEDLKHYYFASDRHKPSQSKRWTDPSVIKDESASPPPPVAPTSKGSNNSHTVSARSHKAKARSPVVDARRSAGAGHRAHSGLSEKGNHSEFKVPSGSARPSGTRRFSNASSSDSPTSANGGKNKDLPPGKKRSTMNSRDAAYEEAIAASLREAAAGGGESGVTGTRSRRGATEVRDDDHDDDEGKRGKKAGTSVAGTPGTARGIKRSRQEEEDGDEVDEFFGATARRQGKKKKDELEANKPKHPNQYTYRKPGPSGSSTATPTQATLNPPEKSRALPFSPSKKQTSSAGVSSNANSRRLGAGTRGGTPSSVAGSVIGGTANTNTSLTWNLPDHLAPFAYTLPPHPPAMLEIITPRPPATGKQRANADPQDAETSAASANTAPATHLEAPTKIRYPTKRMTIGEMRKRVRNLLEFVGRVQGEEDKRAERARLLGLSGQLVRDDGEDQKEAEVSKVDTHEVATGEDAMEVDAAVAEEKTSEMDKETEVKAPLDAIPAENGDALSTAMDVDSNGTAGERVNVEVIKPEEVPTNITSNPALQDTPSDQAAAEPTPTAVPDDSAVTSIPSEEPSASTSTVPPPTQSQAPVAALPQPSKSSQLLADLTSDLIRFQMMFEVGGSVFAAPAGAAGDDV